MLCCVVFHICTSRFLEEHCHGSIAEVCSRKITILILAAVWHSEPKEVNFFCTPLNMLSLTIFKGATHSLSADPRVSVWNPFLIWRLSGHPSRNTMYLSEAVCNFCHYLRKVQVPYLIMDHNYCFRIYRISLLIIVIKLLTLCNVYVDNFH
jgi:hypothetical protein